MFFKFISFPIVSIMYHLNCHVLKTDDTIILIFIKEPTQIKSFPKRLDWGGSANLLRQSVIYEQKKVYTIGRRSRERLALRTYIFWTRKEERKMERSDFPRSTFFKMTSGLYCHVNYNHNLHSKLKHTFTILNYDCKHL
jgi:hypothetical protein